jgi:hypothetical protein
MMKCCAFSNIVIFVSDRNAQRAVWLDSRSPGAGQLDLKARGGLLLLKWYYNAVPTWLQCVCNKRAAQSEDIK